MQERIMVYGGTGSGKSYSWLTIAKKHHIDLSTSIFYCIDTDKAIPRLLATEFKELTNVKVYPCRGWKLCDTTLKELKTKVTENDWLVIDMADVLWDFVQNYFTQQIFSKDIDDYFLQVRKSLGSGSKIEAFKGWTDWQVINKIYQDFIDTVMYELPCNIFITAKAVKYVESAESSDEPSMKDNFSIAGHRPEGEKRNPYRVHTVLYLNHDINGYYATTIKDRGRQQLREFPYTNFAEMYSKVIADEKLVAEPNENRDAYNKEQQYKTFGKWLDKNHVRWSEAREILSIGENDEIVDYHEAEKKIKKVKGII